MTWLARLTWADLADLAWCRQLLPADPTQLPVMHCLSTALAVHAVLLAT